jgi:hypothetical protein
MRMLKVMAAISLAGWKFSFAVNCLEVIHPKFSIVAMTWEQRSEVMQLVVHCS